MVINFKAPKELLKTYESERKPVALSVVEASGELVRSTKYSDQGTHAQDYVKIVQKRAGNITGMGIRYGNEGLCGHRLFDFEIFKGNHRMRLYSLLDYSRFTLLVFGHVPVDLQWPEYVKVIHINSEPCELGYWTKNKHYQNQAILVRPDSYIESANSFTSVSSL